ncbi:MAG TPA: hypothetical protein DCP90_00075 [Clostridiales bacterium]|nr:MAG: hypothetical protein A2Y22_02610 [Clostridiales bacterium GWD2_32_59]HAN08991.1 hypothetical protein [Clostridiales bacterium]
MEKKYHIVSRLIVLNAIVAIIAGFVLHKILPYLLNYTQTIVPELFTTKRVSGISYTEQFIIVISIIMLLNSAIIYGYFKNIDKWLKTDEYKDNLKGKISIKNIYNCYKAPYVMYMFPMVEAFIVGIVLAIMRLSAIDILKIMIVVLTYTGIASIIYYLYSKKLMKEILMNSKLYKKIDQKGKINRISLKTELILQLIPLFVVSILFTSLVGYSRLIFEKGEVLYRLYNEEIEMIVSGKEIKEYNSINEVNFAMKNFNYEQDFDRYFIIINNKAIKYEGGEISEFFISHIRDFLKEDNRVFGMTTETQGVVRKIKINGETGYLGIEFKVFSYKTVGYYVYTLLTLVIFMTVIIYLISRNLAEEISQVALSLKGIASKDKKLDHKLPITSNDEIGELEEAFNEFEEAEQDENERLVEQERLSSLGQLVGGIAHNLKSPIFSVSGAMEGLSDLIDEFEQSLGNDKVEEEDYHDIAKEMREWVEKVKSYASYMNDVITTVKDQAVSSNDDRLYSFTVDEIIKRLDIITKPTLSKNHCILNKDIQMDLKENLQGDITVLIQVLNNLISNAVEAYNGEKGDIDLIIKRDYEKENQASKILFIVNDSAGGIKPEVEEKLFKQMYTTKGKNGTGLGLYISLSTIRGKFGGDMTFETEYGKGTTFIVAIPEDAKNKIHR